MVNTTTARRGVSCLLARAAALGFGSPVRIPIVLKLESTVKSTTKRWNWQWSRKKRLIVIGECVWSGRWPAGAGARRQIAFKSMGLCRSRHVTSGQRVRSWDEACRPALRIVAVLRSALCTCNWVSRLRHVQTRDRRKDLREQYYTITCLWVV